MKSGSIITALATLGVLGAFSIDTAQAAWVRLPNNEVRLINLASSQLPQTALESSSGINNAANLMHEDPTQVATLSAGSSSAVIRLSSQQYVDFVAINNGGVAGAATISGSPDKKEWITLGQVELDSTSANSTVRFAPLQVRYIRIQFEATKAGAINNVVVAGAAESAPADSGAEQASKSVNAASAIGGARAIYASPSPANLGQKAYDLNIVEFPATQQGAYNLVYDLGTSANVKDVALSYTRQPVNIKVYALDELAEKKDWRGKLTLEPAVLESAPVTATASDTKGLGRVKVNIPGDVSARYLAIRIQPVSGAASALDNAINNVAASFGFAGSKMVAANNGGFTISNVFVGSNMSSQQYNFAANNALGFGGGEGDTQDANPPAPDSLDQADTPVYFPPLLLGSYDYRITGGLGTGSGNNNNNNNTPQPSTIVRNNPVIIRVPTAPEVSPVTP